MLRALKTRIVLAAVLTLITPAAALAESEPVTTSRKVKTDLGKTAMTKGDFVLPEVKLTCKLTVTSTDEKGKLKLECEFENTSDEKKKFLYCNMVGLSKNLENPDGTQKFPPVAPEKKCQLVVSATEVKCAVGGAAPASVQPNWHFGCIEVELDKKGTPGAVFKARALESGAEAQFKDTYAWHYAITYSDLIDLTGKTWKDDDCGNCFGRNGWSTISVSDPAGAKVVAAWVVFNSPITDPFMTFQPIGGQPGPKEYCPFSALPAAPAGFPAAVPEFPPCEDSGEILPFIEHDLNLFDIFSMSIQEPTPAFLEVILEGPLPPGMSIQTDPPEFQTFDIPGADELFGSFTLFQDLGNPPPEGEEVNIVTAIFNLVDESPRFEHRGLYIQDTQPPAVTAELVEFLSNDIVEATLFTQDDTTETLTADFWWSIDGGITWKGLPMISVEPEVFQLQVDTVECDGGVLWFFVMQDTVMNFNFYGVGELECPGDDCTADCNDDGLVNILYFICFQSRFNLGCP